MLLNLPLMPYLPNNPYKKNKDNILKIISSQMNKIEKRHCLKSENLLISKSTEWSRYCTIIYLQNTAGKKKEKKEKRSQKILLLISFNLPNMLLPVPKSCVGTEFRTRKISINTNFTYLSKKSQCYKSLTN